MLHKVGEAVLPIGLSAMESHLGFYSAFPDIGNYFPKSGNRIPDIGK